MDRKLVLCLTIIFGIVLFLPDWYSKGCFEAGMLMGLPFVITYVSLSAASRKLETIPALIGFSFTGIPIIFMGLCLKSIPFFAGIFFGALVLILFSNRNAQGTRSTSRALFFYPNY
jgi:hypothetical protein